MNLRLIKKYIKDFLIGKAFLSDDDIALFLCGNEALPNPLDSETELEYIELAEKGDKDAKNKLIEHNLRLVVYISKKFSNSNVDMEDLISVGSIGLIKAVNSFKLEKNIKLAGPERMFHLGFSLTTINGKAIVDASQLKPGDTITTRFAKGEAVSRVEKTN